MEWSKVTIVPDLIVLSQNPKSLRIQGKLKEKNGYRHTLLETTTRETNYLVAVTYVFPAQKYTESTRIRTLTYVFKYCHTIPNTMMMTPNLDKLFITYQFCVNFKMCLELVFIWSRVVAMFCWTFQQNITVFLNDVTLKAVFGDGRIIALGAVI